MPGNNFVESPKEFQWKALQSLDLDVLLQLATALKGHLFSKEQLLSACKFQHESLTRVGKLKAAAECVDLTQQLVENSPIAEDKLDQEIIIEWAPTLAQQIHHFLKIFAQSVQFIAPQNPRLAYSKDVEVQEILQRFGAPHDYEGAQSKLKEWEDSGAACPTPPPRTPLLAKL